MSLRVVVYSVPESPWLAYLTTKLPQLEVTVDTTRNSVDTYLACLRTVGADPVLVLEDDIILTVDFLAKVEAVRQQFSRHVIQFFSMRKDDVTVGSRWDRTFGMTQCHYFPAGFVASLLGFAPAWRLTRPANEKGGVDVMVNGWLKAMRRPYWLHVPSLVQHRQAPSRLGPRSSHRQSPTFVEPDL